MANAYRLPRFLTLNFDARYNFDMAIIQCHTDSTSVKVGRDLLGKINTKECDEIKYVEYYQN